MKKNLEDRISNQIKALTERDGGESERAKLSVALARTTVDCSDRLYRLEKRLLDRFLRERSYVRGFFLDTASKQKVQKDVPVEKS